MPTPDEAAALALYEAAKWVALYRDQMKRGSGQAKAADRIHTELLDWARRRHLGDLYDPAIQVDADSLRRQITARPGNPPMDAATTDLLGDILAALIHRTGYTVVEFSDSELARTDRKHLNITTDDDGCARVEITTEVPHEGS